MLGAIGQGLNGIAAGFERLDQAAGRIARDADGSSLAADMVDLTRAKNQVRASLAVIRSGDEMTGTILDAFA